MYHHYNLSNKKAARFEAAFRLLRYIVKCTINLFSSIYNVQVYMDLPF